MAFRRKFPKRTMRKRKFIRRGRGNAGVKALAAVKQLRRQVSPEVKVFNYVVAQAPNTAGIVVELSDITRGVADNQRVGASVKLLRLSGRFHCQMNDAGDHLNASFRMILFRGKQENGAPYFPNDILANPSGGLLMTSPKNWDNRFHTKIIYDKIYNLSRQGTSSFHINWNFKLFGHLQFASADTDGTDTENGGLYLLLVSDRGGDNVPLVQGYLRLTYTDA